MNSNINHIDPFKRYFDILLLLSVNLNQAIKCCVIIDAYEETVNENKEFLSNELFNEMINCTYRDLLMSVSRIYDKTRDSKCNINELKKYIKIEKDYAINKEQKENIINMLKPLQKEYENFYKDDRNKRLAHTDYNNLYRMTNEKYTYSQIKEFVFKTKETFEYILSISGSYIPYDDIEDLKNKYKLQFISQKKI